MRPTRGWTPYLFAAPALSVFGFAVLVPLALTAYYSLTEWDGFGPRLFVGLQNYRDIASDELFRASFWHVTLYILATLVLEVLVGLCLAGLLAARRGGTAWFRVALFTPVMLPMVVVAVLWSFVYNPDVGLVNSLLGSLGLEQLQHVWLGEESTALWAVCVVSGWVFAGFYMTIFYAALAQIPHEVIEAARLDGAGEWSIFWKIKVPLIANATGVAVLLCVTGGFQGFDLFYVMTNGGPYNATEIPTTYLVRAVFRNGEVGYGSAMAMVLTVVVIVLGAVFSRLRTRWAGDLR